MSKKPPVQKPRTIQKPGAIGKPRPGSAGLAGTSSKTTTGKPPTCPMAAAKLKKQKKEQPAETAPKIYENPAFSIPLTKIQTSKCNPRSQIIFFGNELTDWTLY